MNYVIILLGVVIAILLYYLYSYFTIKATTLSTSVSLKNNQLLFGNNQLKNPSSVHYGYGIWLFINTWGAKGEMGTNAYNVTTAPIGTSTPTSGTAIKTAGPSLPNQPIVIFQRQDNSQLMVYLDSVQPSLYYCIKDNAGVYQRQLITNNFPIQSWTQVIFSADNNIIDIYINGKLVLSNVYSQGLAVPSADASTTKGVQLGNTGIALDANAANFQQWSNMSIDPQTAWSSYMSGNGQSSNWSSYNVTLELTKDKVTQSQISVFSN